MMLTFSIVMIVIDCCETIRSCEHKHKMETTPHKCIGNKVMYGLCVCAGSIALIDKLVMCQNKKLWAETQKHSTSSILQTTSLYEVNDQRTSPCDMTPNRCINCIKF